MTMKRLLVIAAFCLIPVLAWAPAGQDFSGANQSDDPCFKIKQMKKAILESADYKKAVGSRDPAYIQCHPLTITVVWDLVERVDHLIGTDGAELTLTEEYPAYLMLHYGWFDGLQKKQIEKFEILGPEPCYAPCPGRARAELNSLIGEIVCCEDYPYCRKKRNVDLRTDFFQAVPATKDNQSTSLHFRGDGGELAEGEIRSAELTINKASVPKGCGRFWDPFSYKLRVGGTDDNYPAQRLMHSRTALSTAEILEALKTGSLTKSFEFAGQYTEPIPKGFTYTLKGKAKVTMDFAPATEERWRVTVAAGEIDNTGPPILYKEPSGAQKQVSVWMNLDHHLVGEFTLRKVKSDRSYKNGTVASYTLSPKLSYEDTGFYKCDIVPCPGKDPALGYAGGVLDGEVIDQSVTLKWPKTLDADKACVFCKPLKSFLSQVPYRHAFGAGELVNKLNAETLPLKNGFSKTQKIQDWLIYKITLSKLK